MIVTVGPSEVLSFSAADEPRPQLRAEPEALFGYPVATLLPRFPDEMAGRIDADAGEVLTRVAHRRLAARWRPDCWPRRSPVGRQPTI